MPAVLAHDARACGATPTKAYPLLPFAHQTDVPLNAVLTAAHGDGAGRVTFELREVGLEQLEELVMNDCPGRVCSATPGELSPHTEYEYRLVLEHQDIEPAWVPFSTGSVTSELKLEVADVEATVVSSDPEVPPSSPDHYPCGYFRRAQIEFDFSSIPLPVALIEGSSGPDYFSPPLVIDGQSADTSRVAWELVGAPPCPEPLLVDVLGNRVLLDAVCLSEVQSGMGGAGGAQTSKAPEPDALAGPSGCALGSPVSGGAGATFWVLLSWPLIRLRRRAGTAGADSRTR